MLLHSRHVRRFAAGSGLLLTVTLALVFAIVWQPHVSRSSYRESCTIVYAAEQTDSEIQAENASTTSGQSKEAVEGQEEEPLEWKKPRFEEREEERARMVLEQIVARGMEDALVLDAMRHVPRHLFVPEHYARSAYSDRPLPIGQGQTISQPFIVAFMTELLEVEPGDRILEIGTGSGYQAAVLTELTPYIYTIEIIEGLGEQAVTRLNELGYGTVKVKISDGYFGWQEHAPFDGIIVTCATGHIPPPLLEQLKPGGRMIIPVGGVYEVQYLVLVTKDEEGRIRSQALLPVRFVPMTGQARE